MTVRKRVLFLLLITAITLITIDVRGGTSGPIGAVRSSVREVISPLQRGISAVVSPVGSFVDGVTNASDLKRENQKLRKEITQVRTENKTLEAAANENQRLRKLLNLVDEIDVDSVTARIITGSPSNFETSIQVNRGSNSDVKVGDPVVDGDGLVGRVIEVSPNRATVLLIVDSTSGVGVRTSRSEVVGIAQGSSGSRFLSMQFVDPDADVKKGDTVVTSGLQDGLFPPNIPVATIRSVKKDSSGLSKNVQLDPIVDLDRLSVVSILKARR